MNQCTYYYSSLMSMISIHLGTCVMWRLYIDGGGDRDILFHTYHYMIID